MELNLMARNMAQLAIKGHEKRGAEVIALLEMLGGINDGNLYGDLENAYYFIGNLNEIDAGYVSEHDNSKQYLLYSLEEFEKKFPYKVGDKVLITDDVTNFYTITSMTWSGLRVAYKIRAFNGIDNVHEWFAYELKPYKEQREETMEEKIQAYEVTEEICANEIAIEFDPSKFEMIERNGKYFVVKKQPKFPKTYKECCYILGIGTMDNDAQGYKGDLIIRFQELLIARDAYWKIGGDWRPTLDIGFIYSIGICYGAIEKRVATGSNGFLLFPTEEMRDEFFENFKDLIEECKELL